MVASAGRIAWAAKRSTSVRNAMQATKPKRTAGGTASRSGDPDGVARAVVTGDLLRAVPVDAGQAMSDRLAMVAEDRVRTKCRFAL